MQPYDRVRIARKYDELIGSEGTGVTVAPPMCTVRLDADFKPRELVADALEPLNFTLHLDGRDVVLTEPLMGRLVTLGRATPVQSEWGGLRLAYEFGEDDKVVA